MDISKFDSNEELYFYWYCNELLSLKLASRITYHEDVYSLTDKVSIQSIVRVNNKEKIKDRIIFRPHEYTPDFTIYWTELGLYFMTNTDRYFNVNNSGYFEINSNKDEYFSIIDVKGSFNGSHNNSAVTFPLNQKWVYDKYSIIVQKVVPKELFEKTFMPERYLLNDSSNKSRTKKVGLNKIKISEIGYNKLIDYLWKRKNFMLDIQTQIPSSLMILSKKNMTQLLTISKQEEFTKFIESM